MASTQNFPERLSSLLSHGKKGELARFCGVEASTVTRWVKGSAHPNSESLFRIAEFLGVDAKFLMEGEIAQSSTDPKQLTDPIPVDFSTEAVEQAAEDQRSRVMESVAKAVAQIHGATVEHENRVCEDVVSYKVKPKSENERIRDAFSQIRSGIDLLEATILKSLERKPEEPETLKR